jgi:KAP family P-loop domain/WD domain, G-beta repeat
MYLGGVLTTRTTLRQCTREETSRMAAAPQGDNTPFAWHPGPVWAVAVTSDGTQIISAGDDGTLRRWNSTTGDPLGTPLAGHTGPVWAVAVTSDGTQIISAGDDGTLRRWNTTTGLQLLGTGEPAERGLLADVLSDRESGHDALGITQDVHRIAALLAALAVTPPLSVALLGDWGTGKSSFMQQLRDRLTDLASRSAMNGAPNAFAAHVRQVTFNAWHYSDDHLWVGLVEHMFRELALPATATTRPAADQLHQLEETVATKQAALDRLNKDLRTIDNIDDRHGFLGALMAPLRGAHVARAALHRVGQEVRGSGRRLAGALTLAVLGVALVVVGIRLGAGLRVWLSGGGAVAVLGSLVTAWQALQKYTDKARETLRSDQQELDAEVNQAEEDLTSIDPARRLNQLLSEISTAERYERFRGLTGRIHYDLLRLSKDLAAARQAWQDRGATGTPPLQRIVLYVDDLDRCTPQRVVDVLQAVNLLLSMDLFMVVAAVDPRWLLKSLTRHHAGLFDEKVGPLDYLDKIFHIPFALRPMGEHAADYLRSLLPAEDVGPGQHPTPVIPDQHATATPVTETPQPVPAGSSHAPSEQEPTDPPTQPAAPEQIDRNPDIPTTSGPPTPSSPRMDLNPQGLRVHQVEQDFLARLTPVLPTPRAVKKLANLYRLLRLSVPADRLNAFLGQQHDGPYQAAALLLAAVVGAPHEARELLTGLADVSPGQDIVEVLTTDGLPARLGDLITTIRKDIPVHADAATYRNWATTIARYSFDTYDLFAEATTPA